ncbi:MAG TPA: Ku protein [Myxococcaceae bacterium]|nr:Ku protein [Myxococcaceae bacterium]
MSARAISTGTVSFGLVSIPVKLYSTNQSSSGISFNLLHRKCNNRLKQQYICPKDNETVSRDEMVKGYEFAKDQYVVFTDEELKAIEEAASKAIEIAEFVPAEKVDPIYFEGAYYLGPDKGGDRAFRLLVEAMRQTRQCAVAKHISRGKQSLVLVRPFENGLIMQQLRYADEVRPFSEIPIGEAEVRDAELKLAMQFVGQLATDSFKPEKYEDEYRKRLQEIIDRKAQGQAVTLAPAEAPQGQIIDLMEALKASLGQQAKVSEKPEAAEERKPPKRSPRQPAAEDRRGGAGAQRKARGAKS